MSEERSYPIEVIREQLGSHQRDAEAAQGTEWLGQVMEILRREALAVPAPLEREDAIPKYIYPH